MKQVECGKILGEARAIFTNDGPIGGAKYGDGEVGAADFNGSGIWWRKTAAKVRAGQGQTQNVSAHDLFYWNGQDEAQENGKKQGGDNTKVQ